MNNLLTFQVRPSIPEELSFLEVLSKNLWWSWQFDAMELFRRIDPRIWEYSKRNPVAFLTQVPQKRLEELAKDEHFLLEVQKVKDRFEEDVLPPVDKISTNSEKKDVIAYFSMEFGIHESIPIFAGGLGMLAGDHIKAASEKGLSLVGIGLLYRYGYFNQFLNQDGVQQEEYVETDIYNIPVERAHDISGNELRITVPGPDCTIHAVVWKLMVGRIPLYLLDTNIKKNSPQNRDITSKLYSGTNETRLCQEILLGIGGIRALAKMGINPKVCHLNEGHASFASVEKLAQIISTHKVDFETAMEIVPRSSVFTTHTPVAAGYDEFPQNMVMPLISELKQSLGCDENDIVKLAKQSLSDNDDPFSMFFLGLKTSACCNGVSELHGKVARKMWSKVWPEHYKEEVPISHITNGIHIPTWTSKNMATLLDRYVGNQWKLLHLNPEIANRIDDIFDEELWQAHRENQLHLISICRQLMKRQYGRRNAPKTIMSNAETVLDNDVLTIAFARRFTSYKRANLLLMDTDRLESLINLNSTPVQFIFAGKAHPKDNEGKDLIKRLINFARRNSIRHRMVFLENYDINIAKCMTQGADIWLNTPRRPFEACGTSGMKAAVNGVLNASILDGWWCEGYDDKIGWKIGNGEVYQDKNYQDEIESQALYNILENSIIPCFYERDAGGIPKRWIKMMKESIKTILLNFSSYKMVSSYEKKFYSPILKQLPKLTENGCEEAIKLKNQRQRLLTNWNDIIIQPPVKEKEGPFRQGENFRVTAVVKLGKLDQNEVDVQLFYGIIDSGDELVCVKTKPMTVEKEMDQGEYLYGCTLTCEDTGRHGFTVRAQPSGDSWIKNTPELITWA